MDQKKQPLESVEPSPVDEVEEEEGTTFRAVIEFEEQNIILARSLVEYMVEKAQSPATDLIRIVSIEEVDLDG